MVLILLSIAGILYFALQLEDKLKIPSPLGLISLSFVFHYLFHAAPLFTGNPADFAVLVLFLLPVLLIADSLELNIKDLKENGLSLFIYRLSRLPYLSLPPFLRLILFLASINYQ